MSWTRTDDQASVNPKLGQLTDSEIRALTYGVWSYCSRRRNGGLFDTSELRAMVYVTPRGPRNVSRAHLARFEALGLLDRVSNASRLHLDCFMVHDWMLYNGETIAEKVAAYLAKFPDASANETHRELGGKRETVLAAHAAHQYPNGTREPLREPLGNRYPNGTPVCASDPVPKEPKNKNKEPVPVPTSTTDVQNGERAQADDLDFEPVDYRAALASFVDVGDGAEDEPA